MALALRHFGSLASRIVARRPHGLVASLRALSADSVASQPLSPPPPPREASAAGSSAAAGAEGAGPKIYRERLLDGGEEILTEAEKQEKDEIIKDLTRRLSGPLADENGNVPTGEDRPIAIEVDGPSHFYANSKRYTAYTKLKHRLLTRMGYKVLHVPYFEWRRLRGAKEREDYMRAKLQEEPTEWLDPEDEKYYSQAPEEGDEEMSVKPEPPATPPSPSLTTSSLPVRDQSASSSRGPPPTPPPPPGALPSRSRLGNAAAPDSAGGSAASTARKGYELPQPPPTPPPPPPQPPVMKQSRGPLPPPSAPPAASRGSTKGQPEVASFPPFPPPPKK